MGNRALTIFTDSQGSEVSPTVYMHWNGGDVPEFVADTAKVMKGREGDVSYSVARFVAVVAAFLDGNLSLGVFETDADLRNAIKCQDAESIKRHAESFSHGDAGVIIVNCDDFTWKAYGGYLADEQDAA